MNKIKTLCDLYAAISLLRSQTERITEALARLEKDPLTEPAERAQMCAPVPGSRVAITSH